MAVDFIEIAGLGAPGHAVHASDFSGDGLADTVYHDEQNPKWWFSYHAHTNGFSRPDTIKGFNNGAGSTTTINYLPMTDTRVHTPGDPQNIEFPIVNLTTPTALVNTVTSSDGIGGQLSVGYHYAGARLHTQGRGFLGFEALSTTDTSDPLVDVVTTTTYHQGYPLNGDGRSSTIGELGELGEYHFIGLPRRTEKVKYTKGTRTGNSTQPYHAWIGTITDQQHSANGTLLATTVTNNAYDLWANLTSSNSTVSDGSSSYTTNTNHHYGSGDPAVCTNAVNNPMSYHYAQQFGRLSCTVVTKSGTNLTTTTRHSAFDYYGSGDHEGMLRTSVMHPGHDKQLTTRYTYDTYGNQVTTTLSGKDFDPATGAYGPELSRQSTVSYAAGRFPSSRTNAKGQTTTPAFDTTLGVLNSQSVTHPSGTLTTTYTYDDMGTLIGELRPDGTRTNITRTLCNNHCDGIAQARYKVLTQQDGSPDTTVYYDNLDRTVGSTNARDKNRTERRNINGQLVSVTDHNNQTTTFRYNAYEQVLQTQDSAGNIIYTDFDAVGHKTSMNDPDKGAWTYDYNAFGELRRQTDANGQQTWLSYDVLGRKTMRIDHANSGSQVQTNCWAYDSQFNGALDSATLFDQKLTNCNSSQNIINRQTVIYDTLGRPTTTNTHYGGEVIRDDVAKNYYDAFSRVAVSQYNKNFAVVNGFNTRGYLNTTTRADNNQTLRTVTAMNHRGQITNETYLGSTNKTHGFDPGAGLQNATAVGNIASLNFTFDATGNLTRRTSAFDDDNNGHKETNITEDFDYDNLNRLNWHNINGSRYENFCYDTLGNLTYKGPSTSCGISHYYGNKHRNAGGNAGPHAARYFAGKTFNYDNNGNMTNDGIRTIQYSAFDKATRISKGSDSIDFAYGVNRSRFERVDNVNGERIVTHYAGGFERVDTQTGANVGIDYKFTVGDLVITQYINTGAEDSHILVKDHLGSLVALTTAQGQMQKRYRFDAFGSQYEVNTSTLAKITNRTAVIQRGFTGHEMLGSMDIVHMNGRIYDPTLGRFLQADPFIQAPKNGQSLNRYSYVINNPLSLTDPSGYLFGIGKFVKKNWRAFAAIAIVWASHGTVSDWAAGIYSNSAVAAGALTGAVLGAVGGFVATGTLRGTLTGAISGAALGAIGGQIHSAEGTVSVWTIDEQILAHAAASGVLSVLQGDKFGNGFITAGIMKGVGKIQTNRSFSRVMIQAVAGGTISKLTGGKFANGAATSAMQYLVNETAKTIRDFYKAFGVDTSISRGNKATLTDDEIGNSIFNETRSLSGPQSEEARRLIAHTIINGDEQAGAKRPSTAPTTLGKLTNKAEIALRQSISVTVQSVRAERLIGIDPTNGASYFNFRDPTYMAKFNKTVMSPRFGRQVTHSIGPLNNSYPTSVLGSTNIYLTIVK